MESHNFDGVHFLVNVVDSSINFTEASLPNQVNVFELLLEPAIIQDALKWRVLVYLTHGLRVHPV